MSTCAARRALPSVTKFSSKEIINLGREVMLAEASALSQVAEKLDANFCAAVELLQALQGNLIVTGMGKAGLIGQKLAATFASTGTRAHFLHPAEAIHGDLGRVHRGDLVLVLSQSGETGEVLGLLPALRQLGVPLIAISASARSTLGKAAQVTIALGRLDEACSLGLAPSTSTTAMLAVGDALALVVSRLKGFQAEDFAQFHPGGALGLKLSRVEDHMRGLQACRVARADETVRRVLVACTKPGRRTGAIMLLDSYGKLAGLFTDSDLARLIEARNESALDQPISEVMKQSPTTIKTGSKMSAAIEILGQRHISELPVVDSKGRPQGIIDVTDVVGMLPEPEPAPIEEPTQVRIYPMDQYAD
ncbi:MAG: KpsF/GutQ family sugar-phosphate isomerase [Planctomycetales bacterium]|nr:KpsF/GutQ family sugar-phosphate isomerase [Planctomycetales bacterium]